MEKQKNRQQLLGKYFQYRGQRLNIHKNKELLQTDKISTKEKNGERQKKEANSQKSNFQWSVTNKQNKKTLKLWEMQTELPRKYRFMSINLLQCSPLLNRHNTASSWENNLLLFKFGAISMYKI